jgi:hypothetical protein
MGRPQTKQRWKIEKYFSFFKLNLKLDKTHPYTKQLYKNTHLNVLLLGLLISHNQKEIKELSHITNY